MGFALAESLPGKRSDLGIAPPRRHRVSGLGILRFVFRDLATLSFPLVSASIQEAKIFVAKEGKDPQSIGSPPIRLIAGEYDRCFRRNANVLCEFGELLWAQIISNYLIIQIFPPIDVDVAGNVPGIINRYVFVTFDHAD